MSESSPKGNSPELSNKLAEEGVSRWHLLIDYMLSVTQSKATWLLVGADCGALVSRLSRCGHG